MNAYMINRYVFSVTMWSLIFNFYPNLYRLGSRVAKSPRAAAVPLKVFIQRMAQTIQTPIPMAMFICQTEQMSRPVSSTTTDSCHCETQWPYTIDKYRHRQSVVVLLMVSTTLLDIDHSSVTLTMSTSKRMTLLSISSSRNQSRWQDHLHQLPTATATARVVTLWPCTGWLASKLPANGHHGGNSKTFLQISFDNSNPSTSRIRCRSTAASTTSFLAIIRWASETITTAATADDDPLQRRHLRRRQWPSGKQRLHY